MCEEALQQVFRAVIISKICHSSSAWWGFTSATDRQHLKAFLRRSVHSRLCPPEPSDLTELVEAADDCLVFYHRNLTFVTTFARNITTESYYRKTFICLTASLEAFSLYNYQLKSLDFVIKRFFMKLFRTSNMHVVSDCQKQFNCVLPSV